MGSYQSYKRLAHGLQIPLHSIEDIYDGATLQIFFMIQPTKLRSRGVRQGDIIPHQLFLLKVVFKQLQWKKKEINITGERLTDLSFADIILFAQTEDLKHTIYIKKKWN